MDLGENSAHVYFDAALVCLLINGWPINEEPQKKFERYTDLTNFGKTLDMGRLKRPEGFNVKCNEFDETINLINDGAGLQVKQTCPMTKA